jgi:thioredoxin-like negative regulator of GroEL
MERMTIPAIIEHSKGNFMKKKAFFKALSVMVFLLSECGNNPAAPPAIPEGVAMLDINNFSSMTSVSGRISLIDFYSPDIIASREMDSSVVKIAERYKGNVLVGKVNFSEDKDLRYQFDINYVPTFLFLSGGKEARRLEKPTSDDSLAIIIDSLLFAKTAQ